MKNLEKFQRIGFWCVIFASFAAMLWSVAMEFDILPVWKIILLFGILAVEIWFANRLSCPVYAKKEVWRSVMTVAVVTAALTAGSSLLTGYMPVGEIALILMFACGCVAVILTVACGDCPTPAAKWLMYSIAFFMGVLAVFGILFEVFGDDDIIGKIYQVMMGVSLICIAVSLVATCIRKR